MIISYVRLCALSCILPLPSGAYLVCIACLSKSSALSKIGRLWGLTFTPVIVMIFEFCQRGATVDTPFLTVLKTWTSPLEHSVIIHVRVRLEFPEVSAPRLASRPFDLVHIEIHSDYSKLGQVAYPMFGCLKIVACIVKP